MGTAYCNENYKESEAIVALINKLWSVEDKKDLKALYKKSKEECEKFLKDIKVCK